VVLRNIGDEKSLTGFYRVSVCTSCVSYSISVFPFQLYYSLKLG